MKILKRKRKFQRKKISKTWSLENFKSTSTYKTLKLLFSISYICNYWLRTWTKIRNLKILSKRSWKNLSTSRMVKQNDLDWKSQHLILSCTLMRGEIKLWKFSHKMKSKTNKTNRIKDFSRQSSSLWVRIMFSSLMRILMILTMLDSTFMIYINSSIN